MKKILTAIFSFMLILTGGVALSGCGGGETGEVVAAKYATIIDEMKKQDSPFENATRNNVSSDFMLKNFQKKTSGGKVDYGEHDELIALGLDFIAEYSPLAKDYKQGQNISQINDTLASLENGYEKLKEEYKNTLKLSADEDMTIYNGFIARYAEAAREFSSKVYDSATALADYLTVHAKIDGSINEASPTAQAIDFYVAKNLLAVYGDYNDYLMENCKAAVDNMNKSWYDLDNLSPKTTFSAEKLQQITAYFDAVEGERQLVKKVFEKFSCYDYLVVYNGDINAYEKVEPMAKTYATQLGKYYLVYLDTLLDFYHSEIF